MIALLLTAGSWAAAAESDRINPPSWVRVSDDGAGFVRVDDGRPFVPWGFNYDHDAAGRLLEDYWEKEWPTVEEHFREMRSLGANVVRVHLQFGRFMRSPDQPDTAALARLELLVKLAERTGLHLDVTGLGCYHRKNVPGWYDALDEARRWDAQAVFWASVARICAASPAVFCYDLMNEPVLPGAKPESDWLAGEFGGKHFVQRISLDLAGRRREDVARAWMEKLAGAIRAVDRRHLITVGEIPWSMTFPGAKPLFSDRETGRVLDFASIHVYPKTGEVERAMTALRSHALGRPVLIEEIFPLACTAAELDDFIARSRGVAAGWIGFYWGKLPAEYDRGASVAAAITRDWLELFARRAPDFSRR
jgi:hypothetical protein